MTANGIDERTVRTALELACRAPSVHNSQPWRWRLDRSSLHLYADLRRWLPATDPDGRDLVLSCGAALHHVRVALAVVDISTTVRRIPNPAEPHHLAAVELGCGPAPDADLGLAAAISRRLTDRRRYTSWPVPEGFRDELVQRAAEQGCVLRPVDTPADRLRLLAAVRAAAAAQESRPDYQLEIALSSGGRALSDGVPAANIPRPRPGRGGLTLRRFHAGELDQAAVGEHGDGDELFVLGTASDDPMSQLRAGEAMSAVLLHATQLGLATSPLTQPLEVDEARRALTEEILGGTLCPQLVIRVGWAPTGEPGLIPTPRRPLEDVLELVR